MIARYVGLARLSLVGESRVARADRRTSAMLARCGAELREARRAAGLTLDAVAEAARSSSSEVSRVERGQAPWVTMATLARIGAVVGLDLWARFYPGGDPVRDAAHLRLQAAFIARLGSALRVAAEVPVGDERDVRAWDLTLADASGRPAGTEVETRLTDVQAFLRRLSLKRRDGGVDRVIVVVGDTRANRAAVAAARSTIESSLRIDPQEAWAALARGELPATDVLLFVRTPGGPAVGRDLATHNQRPSSSPAARRH